METKLRIVSGLLRGRKLICNVEPGMRPIPDRVREALFSILMHDIPDRPFLDLFAGTGAVGMEALSRGAGLVTFVEFGAKTASDIIRHLQAFGVSERAIVQRADAYRWAERWRAPAEPVNIFLGPPFPDLVNRCEALMNVVAVLLGKLAPESVLVIQTEKVFDPQALPEPAGWDHRLYGRNRLSIWRAGSVSPPPGNQGESENASDDSAEESSDDSAGPS